MKHIMHLVTLMVYVVNYFHSFTNVLQTFIHKLSLKYYIPITNWNNEVETMFQFLLHFPMTILVS